MVKKGLGRGFESLISPGIIDTNFDITASEDEKVSDLRHLNLSEIAADPNQPRRHFDEEELQNLADSIREHGVLQPIVVAPAGKGYEVVAGERRMRAAKMAGLTKIPAIIRTLSSQHKLELSIIENVQRQDLGALETATAYLKLRSQFNLTDEEIGKRVGKAKTTIVNTIRLLNLPDIAKDALMNGDITEGHARSILAIDDIEYQKKLLENIIQNKWSVRRAERYVQDYKVNAEKAETEQHEMPKRVARRETMFTRNIASRLGFKDGSVMQKTTSRGGGQIIIKYKNEADIKRLADILGVEAPDMDDNEVIDEGGK